MEPLGFYEERKKGERVLDLDATINRLFRQQEMLKAAGREQSPEYEVSILELQRKTKERLEILGLTSVKLGKEVSA